MEMMRRTSSVFQLRTGDPSVTELPDLVLHHVSDCVGTNEDTEREREGGETGYIDPSLSVCLASQITDT